MEGIVFHGSPKGDLDVIKSHKSTHQIDCIYATDRRVVALLFMGKGNGDLDTKIGLSDGNLEIIERREGILNKLYNKEGFLYELDGASFEHREDLWSPEVISLEHEIKPLNKTYFPNIMSAIEEEEKKGNIQIYRYPNRPDNVPLDNSDLIEKYISFEEKGLNGSISYLLDIYPEFKSSVEEILANKNKSDTTQNKTR